MSGRIRVLHVDDDPAFAKLTGKFLRRESDRFDTVAETRATDALEYLGRDDADVDCIVSDYALPDMDGVAFLEAVREDHPFLPFVLFTGRGNESVASEALTSGATDYLQKQSGTEQYELLANRIRNAVEKYYNAREREKNDRYRRKLYRITSDTASSVEERIERMLELGCERLGVENGHVARIDRQTGRHAIRIAAGSAFVRSGTVTALEETYCRKTISTEDILTVYNAPRKGWDGDPAYERWGIGCYIGGKIELDGDLYGTVCFVNRQPRDREFTQTEQTFVDLVSRWLSHMFERREHEQTLREFEQVVDAVPDGICVLDDDFEFTMVNAAMAELAGYDREELLGARAALVFDDETVVADRANPERGQDDRGGFAPFDTRIRTAGGDTVRCEIRGTRLSGTDDRRGTVVVVRDVSGDG